MMLLTFTETIKVAPEIIHPFLPIDELSQAAHQAISLVVAVVSLIGKFNFITSLNTFRDDVRCESLWEKRIF